MSWLSSRRELGSGGRLALSGHPSARKGGNQCSGVVIALVLLAHGIGHSMGLLQLFKVATVGFAAVAATVLGWLAAAWFPPLAIGSAVVSLAGIALFPIAFPVFGTIGALAVDLAVLAATVWYGWLPTELSA